MAAFKLLLREVFCIFHTSNFHGINGINLLKYLLQTKVDLIKVPWFTEGLPASDKVINAKAYRWL